MVTDSHIEQLFLHFCQTPGTVWLQGKWNVFAVQPEQIIVNQMPSQLHAEKFVLGFAGYEMHSFTQHAYDIPIEKACYGIYPWIFLKENGRWEHKGAPIPTYIQNIMQESKSPPPKTSAPHKALFTKNRYMEKVRWLQEQILNGECFEANFTMRYTVENMPHPAEYMHLPVRPQYSGFFKTPQGYIWSLSPECLVELQNGHVCAHPIKGTIAKGTTPEADKKAQQTLLSSAKDIQENIMIVDLMRNDLSTICHPHSVEVPKLCALHSTHAVHHLVSTITGTTDASPWQVLKAVFPGGSITGAPKQRSIELLQHIEEVARGPYCGSLFFQKGSTLVANILIRTFYAAEGKGAFHAGGAITLASNPEAEYEEAQNKSSVFREFFS